jgi:phosphoglycolate phosphatase
MKNFIFDLDGTLSDPYLGITNSIIYALKKMGIKPPRREDLRPFIGPPLSVSFKGIFRMTDEESERAIKYYREYFGVQGLFENELFDGIADMLAKLREKGKRVYLATSKPEEYATRILEKFDILKYFNFIAGNTLKEERETKEAVLSYLLNKENLLRSESVMIGDRKYDVSAAKEFSIKSVGINFGFAEENELKTAGADFIVSSVEELENLLLSL